MRKYCHEYDIKTNQEKKIQMISNEMPMHFKCLISVIRAAIKKNNHSINLSEQFAEKSI